MNLQSMLAARIAADKPVRVGLIGAGKFGSMFLAQVPSIAGLDVAVISDLDPERAEAACRNVGWDPARIARTRFTEHGRDVCFDERVEVAVEATGDAPAGIAHAIQAIEAGKHIVMVNVEADALAGRWLARKARAANVIYSMAYGDQPALIAENGRLGELATAAISIADLVPSSDGDGCVEFAPDAGVAHGLRM
jgi:predicted homoserine dehydrogenase-like protein